MTARGFARPNMMGRLYFGMIFSGFASDMFYVLDLAQRVDAPALRVALSILIAQWPQLGTLAARRWYGYRRVPAEGDAGREHVLTVSSDPDAAERFFNYERDPSRDLPVRVLLHQGTTHDQLVIAVHHSMADGEALAFLVGHLGDCYASALSGERSGGERHAEEEPRYRSLLAQLTWRDRWQALRAAVRYVLRGTVLSGSQPTALATFTDAPLPARGRLRYVHTAVSFDEVSRFMRLAVKRQGSLTDVLVTASLRAAIRIWPDQATLPIRVSLPVNIRPAGEGGICNRVGVREFDVKAGGFDQMFAQVSAATAEARAVRLAIVDVLTFALASRLPPAIFEHYTRRYFSRSANTRESVTFTTLGTFDGGLRRFGPLEVVDAVPVGSVIAPPGLRILASTHAGRLNLCVAYLDPVIAPARITALIDAVRAELAAVA